MTAALAVFLFYRSGCSAFGRFWHFASFAAMHHFRSLLGVQRTLIGICAEWLGRE
jgi:hypothetical protein